MAVGHVQVAAPTSGLSAETIESRAHGWLYRRPAPDRSGVRALESGIARAPMIVDGHLIPEGAWFAKLAVPDQGLAKTAFVFRGTDLDGRPFAIDLADAPAPVAKAAVEPLDVACFVAQAGAVLKADDERRLVGGIVLQPDIADSQGDVVSAAEIEKAAHRFMLGRTPLGVQHSTLAPDSVRPVESYLAPADFIMETPRGRELVTKGSWVVVAHVPDAQLWELTKSGGFTGWSIAGTGKRSPLRKQTAAPLAPSVQPEELAAAISLVVAGFRSIFAKEEPPPPEIHVHVPQQAPPIVNVTMPEIPAANVTVNVPPQPAPIVNVEQPRPRAVKAKRDAHGNTTYVPVDP